MTPTNHIARLSTAFRQTNDPAERVTLGADLAGRLTSHGQVAQAREVLAEAERALSELTDNASRARALYAIGTVRTVGEDYPGALADLMQALGHLEGSPDRRLQAAVQAQLGKVLLPLGEPTGAIERLTRALTLVEEAGGFDEVECHAYLGLANVYSRLDDTERAGLFARRALTLAERGEDQSVVLMALRRLGNVSAQDTERLNLLGQPAEREAKEAIMWYERARPLARELGDRLEEVWLVNNTSHVLRLTGREAEAAALVEEVLDQGTDDLSPMQVSLLLFNLGDARLRMGQPGDALPAMREALRIAEETRSLVHLPKLHLGLAETYERLGEADRAVEHHKAYHEVERRLRGEDVRSKALLAAVRLEKEELAQVSSRLREESDALYQLLESLKDRNNELSDQVRRDPLTGLANRLAFDEWLEYLPGTLPGPVSVALLDLDRFKEVNDQFSHLVGDEVLRHVATLLRGAVRHGDLVARYGGEEFAVVLPATRLEEAATVCERVRRMVADADWTIVRPELRITLSVGVAQEDPPGRALNRADQRLYAAKAAGRNRVVSG